MSLFGRISTYSTRVGSPVSQAQVQAAAKQLRLDDAQVATLAEDIAKDGAFAAATVHAPNGAAVTLTTLIEAAGRITEAEAQAVLASDTAQTDAPASAAH